MGVVYTCQLAVQLTVPLLHERTSSRAASKGYAFGLPWPGNSAHHNLYTVPGIIELGTNFGICPLANVDWRAAKTGELQLCRTAAVGARRGSQLVTRDRVIDSFEASAGLES